MSDVQKSEFTPPKFVGNKMNFRLFLIGFKKITAVIMTVFYDMCHKIEHICLWVFNLQRT